MSSRISGRLVVPSPGGRRPAGDHRSLFEARMAVGSHLRSLHGVPRERMREEDRAALTDPTTGEAIPPLRAVFALHADRHHPEGAISAMVWDAARVRDEVADRSFFRKRPPADPGTPYGGMLAPPGLLWASHDPRVREAFENPYDDSHDAFKFIDEEGRRIPGPELSEAVGRVAELIESGRLRQPLLERELTSEPPYPRVPLDSDGHPKSTAGTPRYRGDTYSVGAYDVASRAVPPGYAGKSPQLLVRYHRYRPQKDSERTISEVRALVVYVTNPAAYRPREALEEPIGQRELPGCACVAFFDAYLSGRELYVRWYWNIHSRNNLENELLATTDDAKRESIRQKVDAAREVGRLMVRGAIDALRQHGDLEGPASEYSVRLDSTLESVEYYRRFFGMRGSTRSSARGTTTMRGSLDRLDRAALTARRGDGWGPDGEGTLRGTYVEVGPYPGADQLASPPPKRLADRLAERPAKRAAA